MNLDIEQVIDKPLITGGFYPILSTGDIKHITNNGLTALCNKKFPVINTEIQTELKSIKGILFISSHGSEWIKAKEWHYCKLCLKSISRAEFSNLPQ